MIDWVILSLLMLVAVAANSLAIRLMLAKGVAGSLINCVNFAFCSFAYFIAAFMTGEKLNLSAFQIFSIASVAVLFNYLGNVFFMQSIERAPNPGYGLAIMKSNAVMTMLLSVFLFKSVISEKSFLAGWAVLFFMALITWEYRPQAKNRIRSSWVLPSFGAFFCFGCYSLAMKYLLLQKMEPIVILAYLCLVLAVMFYFDVRKLSLKTAAAGLSVTKYLAVTGLLSIATNLLFAKAVAAAPNPGYVGAVDAASGALVAVGAAWIFKDSLSPVKLIGILGVAASLAVLLA